MRTEIFTKESGIKEIAEPHLDEKKIIAGTFYSGFMDAHDTYNAITSASDGKIYYVLSSDKHNVAGRIYCYNPSNNTIKFLGDLSDICGEKDKNLIAQGKSHVEFFEIDKKLYFATHVGFYELIDGMDRLPVTPPKGYGLYPGGHILCYDLTTGFFDDLAVIPNGEGVVAMTTDCERKHIFLITWPTGHFMHYDIINNVLIDLGKITGNGEAGMPGNDFRTLCRSLVVNSSTGVVYFSSPEGDIFSFKPGDAAYAKLQGVDLRKDYFGKYDITKPGNMAYNWRKIFWHDEENVAYAVHGNSGYLIRINPVSKKVELIDRITSEPSKKSGMYDQFSYGYLGFVLGPDKKNIYYLTGGPIYIEGKRLEGEAEIAKGAARGEENLHLVTYNLATKTYQDHGPVFYENGDRPSYVNSITIGADGTIYTLARVKVNGKIVTDLVRIPNPFKVINK
ncbi:MAG: hypothetical protein ACK5NK_13145 [Niabella sp.]